jgi:hypothetical protein
MLAVFFCESLFAFKLSFEKALESKIEKKKKGKEPADLGQAAASVQFPPFPAAQNGPRSAPPLSVSGDRTPPFSLTDVSGPQHSVSFFLA